MMETDAARGSCSSAEDGVDNLFIATTNQWRECNETIQRPLMIQCTEWEQNMVIDEET